MVPYALLRLLADALCICLLVESSASRHDKFIIGQSEREL